MSSAQKRSMDGRAAGKRYRIGQLLRRASSGDVYACRDFVEGNHDLVIRITPAPDAHENHEDLGRRIVLLQKLRHPGIENIVDFGILAETGELFLVSRRAEGPDFYSGTENSELPVVLTLFSEILHILRYPHARGLIHGNLKPESVLLFENSKGRVIPFLRDFSLSCRLNRTGDFHSRESVCYAAPELLLEGRESKETDFYAIGVLLYQSLTRRLPFEDGDPDFVVQKQIQGNIDLDPVECLDGGESVMPLLKRLLEKNPEKRVRSVEEALSLMPPQIRRGFDLPEEKAGRFSAAPFIEREKEMRLLRERAERVKESGRGRTVFIAGETGSGKTRFMEELRGWALVNGWRVVQCACSAREESPYAPFMRILGKTDVFEPIAKDMAARSPSLQVSDNAAGISGLPAKPEGFADGSFFEDVSLVAESDFSMSGWFHDRLTRELVRRLSGRPTVLLLHDVHWASSEACAVLEYLCADIMTHPILICAGFRPEETPGDAIRGVVGGVRRAERGEVVSLNPLTKKGVLQMIAGLTGIHKHQEHLRDWMFRAIGGNPLFLREMLDYLAERGILRNQSGGWEFTPHLPAKPGVPDGIGAIIEKRLARLSPTAMETLKWLSLFTRPVPRRYTELLTASDGAANDASLAELNRCRLLRVESSADKEAFAPGNELIAEIAKEMIPPERKRKMYREIAELLEKEAGKDRLYEAALHYIESPPDERSIRCALTAITSFQAVFAHENALRCFEYAFKYKNRLMTKEIFQAMIPACDSMFALGKAGQAIRLIHSALRSRAGIEPELKARLYLCLATAYRHAGDRDGQEQSCHAGLRALLKDSSAGRDTETMLWTELAFSAAMRFHARDALLCLDRAMEACPDRNSPIQFGSIQNLYAILYCAVCEFKKAADAGEKAIAVLGHSDEHIQKCSVLSSLGLAHMRRGRFAAALRLHLRTLALSEKSRYVAPRVQAYGNLAECLCHIGQIQKSFAILNHAYAAAKESNNPAIYRACDAVAADINLAACNYSETRRILKALESGEKQTLSVFTARCVDYVSAKLNFSLGDFANALDDIRKLREKESEDAALYEYELAEALGERILFERDADPGALERLWILENRVARKRWPYQRCLIKLHICEILIRLNRAAEAESCARNALRLSTGMRSASLQCRAYLMLGISLSPLRRASFTNAPAFTDLRDADRAICSLTACLNLADASCSMECRWRALAELSFMYQFYKNYELCLHCARQAYETLVKLEERTPPDMLDSFRGVFERGRVRMKLARLIETGQPPCRNVHVVKCPKSANAEILMRMIAIVNSVREIRPLLDGLLDLALSAIAVRRGMIFLWNETADKLEQIGGRDAKKGCEIFAEDVSRVVLESILKEGRPLVSANASGDPRIIKDGFADLPGKLLCLPLKTPERTIGVFYGDCLKPVKNIGEAEIDLAKAFCSLTALAVDDILARRKLAQADTKSGFVETSDPFPEIIGAGSATRLLKDRIRLVAASPLDVLITGESGCGKELVARAISDGDRKRNGKFIPVDCGALADGVAEAELFGCRRGAFTGATEDRSGLFEAASGGVLFLDEISNMPTRMQVKLLRVLQEREVRRIGDTLSRKIEIRVVAATNKDLPEEIKNGHFCHDLFFRLRAVEIHLPSLRERAEDIPLLIERFLQGIFDQEKGEVRRFSPEALELLRQYSYPGNIRELKNIVASAYYYSPGHVIEARALPPEVRIQNTAGAALNSAADNLYSRILAGEGGFEDLVKKPYLDRRLDASVVCGVIQRALSDSSGVYKNAFARLRIPKSRYAPIMQFLKRHRCYLDFLPFRRDSE
ncbi:MAG: sigma 54-interacting transcriptional regulator [Acidobacteriota bacterium]|nr:sigma 54-interacting transcriptional regulator [Acidobacteriota bacterium]